MELRLVPSLMILRRECAFVQAQEGLGFLMLLAFEKFPQLSKLVERMFSESD